MSTPSPNTPRPSFWKRRLLDPVLALLTQGITPDRIAATLATGTVCSLFPFLGATSLLNLAVGLCLRMNQPILQTLNQLLGPLQLLLILVHVRIGESLWFTQHTARFSIGELISSFGQLPFSEFLVQFGWAGIHALTGWLLTAPLVFLTVYLPLRPLIRRISGRNSPRSHP
jgi:uncharacterized protein (DUF2062 family)